MTHGMTTHGEACNARTFPTTCAYCGMRVYFFRCDHDCKVFFEVLGPPWTKHHCDEYQKATGRTGPQTPERPVLPPRETLYAWAIMSPKTHDYPIHVEPSYAAKMRHRMEVEQVGKRERLRMEPPPTRSHQDVGQIVDLAEEVDIYKQSRLKKDSLIATALLGPLASEPMARILLIVDDSEQDDLEEYACYISQRLLKMTGAIRGDVVYFIIKPVEVPGWSRVWLCTDLELPVKW